MLTHTDPVKSGYQVGCGGLFLAEDCLLAQPIECLLTRKLPLKLDESAAIYDSSHSIPTRFYELGLIPENGV